MQTNLSSGHTQSVRNRRTFERSNTWVHALLRFGNRTQTIVVRDVSSGGMKIEYAFGLVPGDQVTIEFASSRTLEATVDWSVAAYCGVEFMTPLAADDPALIACKMH